MSHIRTIKKIYDTAFKSAVELQIRREGSENYVSKDEQKHLKYLEDIISICEKSPYFFTPPTDDDGNIDFSFVTPKWIKAQLEDLGIRQNELAAGVNVTKSQVSNWLGEVVNPSGAAQAAIYYFLNSRK